MPTEAEYQARIVELEEANTALRMQNSAYQLENMRLALLVPPDSDNTSAMTVSEYRYHTVAAYRALGILPAGTANTALKEKWNWMFRALESLDQSRRVNTRVPPFLSITNEMFTDGLIGANKRDFLNTFGA
jgi:hypothetical protein